MPLEVMQVRLVVATRNRGKVKEILDFLPPGAEVLTLADFPHLPPVVEDGKSFLENAVKKAREVAMATGITALADDSGLEVEALNGAPGIFSARYAGEGAKDEENNAKLLRELEGVPWEKRRARFVCVIAVATPEGRVYTARGVCEGFITFEPRGDKGFGYDPLFYVPELDKTFAELEGEEKHKVSHRGKALRTIEPVLKQLFAANNS